MFYSSNRWLRAICCGALIVGSSAVKVSAFPALQAAFIKEYVAGHQNKEFVDLCKKAKCNICHQGRKDKHNRNAYGVQLAELVDMKKDGKNAEKLKEALVKVAAMHSVAKDDKSPTYGELIADGKLPGGDLEAALKEPEKKKE